MKRILHILAFGVAMLQGSVGETAETPSEAAKPSGSEAHQLNRVRSITLPHFEPDLPLAPGRDQYPVVCVSCHSPRYVTMQPLFPQRQWEATVDKMAKNYGAQMDQGQRQAIVGYLVTIHGPDSKSEDSAARDDDMDIASPAKPASPPETAPSLGLAPDDPGRVAEADRGAVLFNRDCAACHGTGGAGDGWVGRVLLRRPKNLAATRFSMPLLSQVLWNGKRGTAMPSWRGLSKPELTALAAYVQSLHQPVKVEDASPEVRQRGGQVFQQNCAPCHGASGDGKGPAAATLTPEPANFKLKQPDVAYILQVLSDGIPGTAMPAWKNQIKESDRQALADFLRSLFDPVDAHEP